MRTRWRSFAGALLALLSLGSGVALHQLRPALEAAAALEGGELLSEGDRQRYERFSKSFGADDVLLVTLTDEDERRPIFREAFLKQLRALTARLGRHPEVEDAISLTSLEDFRVVATNPFERALVGQARKPSAPQAMLPSNRVSAELETQLRQDAFLTKGLLGVDGKTTAIWIRLSPEALAGGDALGAARRLAAMVPERLEGLSDTRVRVVGFPLLRAQFADLALRHGLLVTLAAIVLVALVALAFRVRFWAVLAWIAIWPPLTLAGLFVLAGLDGGFGPFTPSLLPLLVIVSSGVLFHLERSAEARRPAGRRFVVRVCGLAALSTAAGFLALATSSLAPLAHFGVEAALGALVAFGAALLALLIVGPPAASAPRPGRLPRFGRRLARHPLAAAGVLLLGLPWFLLGGDPLERAGDFTDLLPKEHPLVADTLAAIETMDALYGIELVLRLPEEGAAERIRDADFHVQTATMIERVRAAGGERIGPVLGSTTLLSYLNTKIDGGGFVVTPASARFAVTYILGPYLLVMKVEAAEQRSAGGGASATAEEASGPDLIAALKDRVGQILSPDGTQLRWHVRLDAPSPRRILELREILQPVLAAEAERLGATEIGLTGRSLAYAVTTEEVLRSQERAVLLGGAVLIALLALVLRSWRALFAALVVNVGALCGLLNLLTWLGIGLDLHSVILIATVLGILLDDSLHMLAAGRRRRPAGAAALAIAGSPVLATSVALAVGFAAFALSPLPLFRDFALAAVAGVTLALLFDLVVLPRLMR